ncbi:MAG: GyrI-like domain-containing protein [Gammaproteobacteria bacterium]
MKKTSLRLDEIKLIGITVRTNNEAEFGKLTGKIFPCVQQYFQQQLFNKISNRKNPGTTYCAYTDYESDHTGDYTYFIGETVNSFENVPAELTTLTIPAQNYAKFTTNPGSMPEVLMNAWQYIWETSTTQTLGGSRRYETDFEVYDERAADQQNMVLDIFIGINTTATSK